MPLVQFNLPDHLDNKIAYYRVGKKLVTKGEAISEILEKYFRANPDFFERLGEND